MPLTYDGLIDGGLPSATLDSMRAALATALRDETFTVWTSAEMNGLLAGAVAELYPRVASTVRESVPLTSNVDQYALTTVSEVSRVDILDELGRRTMALPGGTWEVWGNQETAGVTLYINPGYSTPGLTLRVHGYAPYDLNVTAPPLRLQKLALAIARAEALRRMVGSRARYEKWMALNQKANVSVNELTQMMNEADGEAARLRSMSKTWRRPVPAR